jgi:chaperonin GroES
MKVIPLGKNILARQVEEAKTTVSGIVLPDSADKKDVTMLDVLSVGSLVEDVKEGDRILARRQFLDPLDLGDGTKIYSLESDDVLAIVVKEE